ncbi:PRKR-interacting protein 1 homolog isoform X2 [Temnothorax curvispinosus]|uniref:PRKR-interacting protein 1 homolog isoform X2 n=1 Tax=Temnothorax curvispinosus TaxID=300111 RepID=A0A6J1QEM6_9HYME|nr:PRKR-interacting protein 1 homolog isoform X2 [Temnothorax curvispinosus]
MVGLPRFLYPWLISELNQQICVERNTNHERFISPILLNFPRERGEEMSDEKEKDEEKPVVPKTAVDLQRLKLMKLMKNADKPVMLPERPKAKNTPSVPEFVRNVMGSSAGAGSGEFHVYRHLRRKEYARQKFIQEKAHKEHLDDEYHQKLEEYKRLSEEATAKKRAKRLKKKQLRKLKKRMKAKKEDNAVVDEKHSESDSSDEDETKAVESSEVTEENDSCPKNISTTSTSESEVKATEMESSLPVEESQDDTLKAPSEVSSENIQCESGT